MSKRNSKKKKQKCKSIPRTSQSRIKISTKTHHNHSFPIIFLSFARKHIENGFEKFLGKYHISCIKSAHKRNLFLQLRLYLSYFFPCFKWNPFFAYCIFALVCVKIHGSFILCDNCNVGGWGLWGRTDEFLEYLRYLMDSLRMGESILPKNPGLQNTPTGYTKLSKIPIPIST
jgi:hypothetical protein